MAILEFPTDCIVGTVDWDGSWTADRGPVLAIGQVEVPDGTNVGLHVQALAGREPAGDGSWSLLPSRGLVDLGLVSRLPPQGIESVSVQSADEASFGGLAHLAPGLRRLYLQWSNLGDAVLPTVAKLTELTYLQTFGNAFTDAGVQAL